MIYIKVCEICEEEFESKNEDETMCQTCAVEYFPDYEWKGDKEGNYE